jgi:MYXO-CTERM domain-containing protein
MNHTMKHALAITSVLAPLALSAAASAAITSVSGQAVQIAPPASAIYGALPGPPAFCWDEQSGVSSTALLVNTIGNGTFTGGSWGPTVAGGVFESHMIHFDASTGVAVVQGAVTFSGNIVAVIYENNLLDISDGPLGAFGTTYATGDPFRSHSTNLGSTSYTVAGNTLTFTLWANSFAAWPNKMAQLRVLTDAVPGPGAAALLGVAGIVGRRGRRR